MKRNRHSRNLAYSVSWIPRVCGGAALLAVLALLPFAGLAADPSSITTTPGREFSISLDSNPTTGYQWQLAKPVTGTCIALVTNRFVRPTSKLAGAPGQEVWKFKALRSGEMVIELQYVRPWEKGSQPAQKTNFTVVVTAPKPAK